MIDIIQKKRDGHALSKAEIDFFIKGYVAGEIPDYQVSSLLMAIYFQDMTDEEITHLTLAMAYSGDTVDLSVISGIKVDKHSTGGVGDATTLVLAPLVAAVGVPVAKMSGRGLGHTGGTIDKFESIPGFEVEMAISDFIRSVNDIGVAVVGQSGDLAPADKLLYALRDVTGTVDAIPLIASSIMSKKIAAGADSIVLDVTVGEGAFMKSLDDAKRLAETMVRIGKLAGRQTKAIISDMSEPLGNAIGNGLEMYEAIEALNGRGPEDLMTIVYALGAQMTVLAGVATSLDEAQERLKAAIKNGKALEKFKALVQNQQGDVRYIDQPERFLTAQYQLEVPAPTSGFVQEMVADQLGKAAMLLGAGRKTKADTIDAAVGLTLNKKVGQQVAAGETLVTIHSNRKDVADVLELIEQSIKIGEQAVEPRLIHAMIE
jgi:pyrimidine-nucleoside phosphorylase